MTHMMLHVTSGKLHMNPTYFFHQTETLQDHIDTRNSNVLMIKNSGHCKLHDGHTNFQQVRNKLLVSLRLSNTFEKLIMSLFADTYCSNGIVYIHVIVLIHVGKTRITL